jgi:hypothetical protein
MESNALLSIPHRVAAFARGYSACCLRERQQLEHRAGVEPAIRALQARALATWRPVLEISNKR